ncbi:MAG: peptidoglycan-binding domain-containing protein [Pseudomonadota bacterium]
MTRVSSVVLLGAIGALGLTGCASDGMSDGEDALRAELEKKTEMNAALQSRVGTLEAALRDRGVEIEGKDSELEKFRMMSHGGGDLFPPAAKPGECYARVFIPPQYESVTKTVVAREASERVEVIDPEYGWVEEQILVKESSTELRVVPARYETVDEQVLVREASSELVVEPAVYDTVTEQVMVRPAYTTWKKGRGPIERIDEATGEIMCLVEVPAQYRTVSKQVLVSPAKTRSVEIPAEYRTVTKRVMVEPARTESIEIPAEYKTVKVKKIVTPASERRITIPEETATVTEQRLVSEGEMAWRPILCETNTTPQVISKLQRALSNAGYNPGPNDGVLGAQTRGAVSRYQEDNNLSSGQLTMETLKKLGVQ